MSTNKGMIYLIQPAELVGTDRYKIGCSKEPSLKRCNKGYKKNSRYLIIEECSNPMLLEDKIKKKFNEKFNLIAGNEYFQGNEDEMKKEFRKIIDDFNNNEHFGDANDDENTDDDIEENSEDEYYDNKKKNDHDENINKIKNEFPNYKDDESFGGQKKLIKIFISNNYPEFIININEINKEKKIVDNEFIISDIECYEYEYIKQIITKKIIKNNKIYDLNDSSFICKLHKYKKKYDIILSNKIIKHECYKNYDKKCNLDKIKNLILSDCILNNFLYCDTFSLSSFQITFNDVTKIVISMVKLYDKLYDYQYLREYIPYVIEYCENEYYIINRDYTYIGLNVETSPDKKNKEWKRESLFNDGTTCWKREIDAKKDNEINNKFFKNIIMKYKHITKNKTCLNMNENTENLISLVPIISYTNSEILKNIPGYLHFWFTQPYCPNGCKVSSTKLYNLIKEYSKKNNHDSSFTQTLFSLEMKKIGFNKVKNSGIYYIIPKLDDRKIILKTYNNEYYNFFFTEYIQM
jgi:hypothetical protein